MVCIVDRNQVEVLIVIDIWNRVVLCASYVGLMEFDEGCVGDIGTNIIWFYDFFCFNRLTSEQGIFIVKNINRHRDILDTESDMVCSDEISCILSIFVDMGGSSCDCKTKIFNDRKYSLITFGS